MRARCTGPLVSECIYTSRCNKVASSCFSFLPLSLSLPSLFFPSSPLFPLFFPSSEVAFTRGPRSYFHPRCSVKTETCHALLPSRWRDRFDAENVIDTPRLSILEFLNIQQCIVFDEDTRSRASLPFSLSLSLSRFLFLFHVCIYIYIYVRDRSQLRFPRYSNIGMIFADKLHFIRRPVIN